MRLAAVRSMADRGSAWPTKGPAADLRSWSRTFQFRDPPTPAASADMTADLGSFLRACIGKPFSILGASGRFADPAAWPPHGERRQPIAAPSISVSRLLGEQQRPVSDRLPGACLGPRICRKALEERSRNGAAGSRAERRWIGEGSIPALIAEESLAGGAGSCRRTDAVAGLPLPSRSLIPGRGNRSSCRHGAGRRAACERFAKTLTAGQHGPTRRLLAAALQEGSGFGTASCHAVGPVSMPNLPK